MRKLKQHCETHGGHVAVAEKSDLKPAYLDQVLKGVLLPPKKGGAPRSPRSLGDAAARAIEVAYGLGRGWFDNDESEAMLSPKELQLLGHFRQLDHEAQDEMLRLLFEGQRAREQLTRDTLRRVPAALKPEPTRSEGKVRGRSVFGGLDELPAAKRRTR